MEAGNEIWALYEPLKKCKILNFCQLYLTAVEQQRALCALAQYKLPGRYLLTCSIDNQSEAVFSGQWFRPPFNKTKRNLWMSSVLSRDQQVRSEDKFMVWNGLTAKGLASPLVRVTRLCEVVPPSWCLKEEGGESPPPSAARRASLPGRSHSIPSVSAPPLHHLRQTAAERG